MLRHPFPTAACLPDRPVMKKAEAMTPAATPMIKSMMNGIAEYLTDGVGTRLQTLACVLD